MMWSPAHDLAIGLVTLLHWPLAAVGAGRGYYRGEPPGAAVAAVRRAGSPWSEQMDRKMLRFVEKRGIRTDKTPPARTEVLSARGEESKPVAHPCRGLGGQERVVTHLARGGNRRKYHRPTNLTCWSTFVALVLSGCLRKSASSRIVTFLRGGTAEKHPQLRAGRIRRILTHAPAKISSPHRAFLRRRYRDPAPISRWSGLLSDFPKIFTISSEFLITLGRCWFRDLTWYMR